MFNIIHLFSYITSDFIMQVNVLTTKSVSAGSGKIFSIFFFFNHVTEAVQAMKGTCCGW